MRHVSVPRFLPPLVLVALVGAGLIYLTRVSGSADGPLQASGTVESIDRVVASELAGRVIEVLVEEGDLVEAGEVLVRLDRTLLQAQRERSLQAIAAAQASLASAEANANVAKIQFDLAQTAARRQERSLLPAEWADDQPADFALPGWYFSASESFDAASRQLESASHEREAARSVLAALLAESGFAGVQESEERLAQARAAFLAADAAYDQAVNAFRGTELLEASLELRDRAEQDLEDAQEGYDQALEEVDGDRLDQARAEVAATEAGWLAAVDELNRWRFGDRSYDLLLAQARLDQARAGRDQAAAARQLAEADLAALDVQIAKLDLAAPSSGVVLARSVEPGEVLQPGAPALTIGALDSLTITVFLPEDRYGEVSLGDEATVTVDSFPEATFRAVVVRIAEQAEYTPRNVQTDEGRRTTVFAIELSVEDAEGRLKPGMPADVRFGEA